MKADERKHLKQNELLTRLKTWWQGGEGKSGSSTVYVILAVAALVVIGYLLWNYYSEASIKNRSSQWQEFDQAVSNAQLELTMDAAKGTTTARAAKAQLARGKLQEGLRKLGSDTGRKDAIDLISSSRSLYQDLLKEVGDDQVLARECLLSLAKAEESLIGIPKSDNAQEMLGDIDRALEHYQQLADRHGDSIQGKEAADRAKDIRENKAKIVAFYTELNKAYARTDIKSLDIKPSDTPKTPDPTKPPMIGTPTPPIVPVDPPKTTAPMKTDPTKTEPAKTDPIKPVTPTKPPMTPPADAKKTESTKPEPTKPADTKKK